MRKYSIITKCALLCSVFLALFCSHPLYSAESPKNKISEWLKSNPWLGLVAKEVTYGPITLRGLDLDKSGRLVFAKPGEEIDAVVRYKIDSDKLDSWNLHHILVGLKGKEGPTCITHSWGVRDKEGKSSFVIRAPEEKGVYEVRFDYQEALLCSDAAKVWNEDSPSAKATIGIIIVE